jgi:cellulose biosynthesis protein BcsQ
MRIIAVTNIKGGVGKTTTAVNLAFLCAAAGESTLLWDLDPQGAATYILKCEPNQHASAKKLRGGRGRRTASSHAAVGADADPTAGIHRRERLGRLGVAAVLLDGG